MTAKIHPPEAASGLYPRVALFSAILASAGLPLYIHLPSFAVSERGIDLATLGVVLLSIRLIDLFQDPALGWMIDRWPCRRPQLAVLGLAGLALGFVALFVLPAPAFTSAVIWMICALILVFTSYSLLQILFYGQGVRLAGGADPARHLRLAGWREAGLLLGILIAASAPQILTNLNRETPYRDFGLLLIALILLTAVLTRPLWRLSPVTLPANRSGERITWRLLAQPMPLWVLLIGLINALPVALSSTLFVFFVEDQLALPQFTGLFLLLFFCAAGLAAPIWARLARKVGARQALCVGMVLSIISFGWALTLPAGSGVAFGVICLTSGAALAADMVILPAGFASVLARMNLPEGMGFSLWTFVAKLALALAAAVVLPALSQAGYNPGAANQAEALQALSIAYALVPCLLKLGAIAALFLCPAEVFAADHSSSQAT